MAYTFPNCDCFNMLIRWAFWQWGLVANITYCIQIPCATVWDTKGHEKESVFDDLSGQVFRATTVGYKCRWRRRQQDDSSQLLKRYLSSSLDIGSIDGATKGVRWLALATRHGSKPETNPLAEKAGVYWQIWERSWLQGSQAGDWCHGDWTGGQQLVNGLGSKPSQGNSRLPKHSHWRICCTGTEDCYSSCSGGFCSTATGQNPIYITS